MNTATVVIITVLSVLLFVSVSYLVWQNNKKKWSCTTEGKCEVDINGDYPSKSDCLAICQAKHALMMERQQDELGAWACNSNHQCVRSDQGYTSKELCEQNCVPSSYWPQTLLWPFRPGPRYYRHRRHGHKRGCTK